MRVLNATSRNRLHLKALHQHRSTVPRHPNQSLHVWFACCTTWEISFGITSVLLVIVACSSTENAAKNCRSGRLRSVTVRTTTKILQTILHSHIRRNLFEQIEIHELQ